MPKFECVHADTCPPDCWGGHHLPHIAIPIWRGMTLRQIKQSIRDELRDGAVAGSNDHAILLSAGMISADREKEADRVVRAAYAAINRIKPARKGQRKFFKELEPEPEFSDPVYAFFVFVER